MKGWLNGVDKGLKNRNGDWEKVHLRGLKFYRGARGVGKDVKVTGGLLHAGGAHGSGEGRRSYRRATPRGELLSSFHVK